MKRRSLIRQVILRYKIGGATGYKIGFKSRMPGVGERIKYVDISRIIRVGGWALELDDGSSIPYHRIVEVRNERGEVVWIR